jgi:O-antigen biosynthesis protein
VSHDPGAIGIADVELTPPLPTIVGLAGYAAVRAVARLHGVPVAEPTVPASAGQATPEALADALVARHLPELTRHLLHRWLARPAGADAPSWEDISDGLDAAAIAALPEPPEPPLPFASVAVCTRDRPEDLARCLDAISALDYPRFEVLIVDNAPRTDATKRLVRERFPQFHYVHEPRPGLDWARNRAIVESSGEILAFTDDDVIVDRGWLRAIGRVFGASPAVAGVAGMIAPAELETRAQRAFEAYGGFGRGWQRKWLRRPRRLGAPTYWHHGAGWIGAGANMAFRRSTFDQLGGFDPALDVGTATMGGGDLDIFFRVLQEGLLLVYAPEALVRHRHRRGDDELARQLTTWGRCYLHAYVHANRRRYPEERRAFARLALWWWKEYVGRNVARGMVRGHTLESELRLHELRGVLRGVGVYRKATRTANALLARHPDLPTMLPRPSAPRAPVPPPDRLAERTVSIDAPVTAPLEGLGEVAGARVTVTSGGRVVAEATVVPEGDGVSAAQLRDAIALSLAGRLLTDRSEPLRRAVRAWLVGADAGR